MTENSSAQIDSDSRRDWCAPRRFALVLGALIFVSFARVLLGFETFAIRDYGLFSYPVAFFRRLCFWKGQIPLWNPYDCCGLPFLAQLNTLTLYPLSLIYLLLPLGWSLSFFCIFHLFLGGMGMYFLAARWTGSRAGAALAGVVFAFNGLSITFLMWPSHIATLAWLPWVIYWVEAGWQNGGRKMIWAALAATMEVLGGGPETILFTWMILFAMLLIQMHKSQSPLLLAGRFFLMGTLAFGLAAPQLLPFADFAIHSSRDTHFAASEWSMPPWGWASFLVPLFQTSRYLTVAMQPDQSWTGTYYEGITVMLLVMVAVWRLRTWRVWLLGGFLLAALILAIGDKAFLYKWLREAFPFLGMFRYPIKFVILSTAVIPLLAAFAIAHYENDPLPQKGFGRVELTIGAVMILLVAVILWFARYHPVQYSLWLPTLINAISRVAFLGAGLGALYFFARRREHRGWSILVLLALVWMDLFTSVPSENPTLDASVYQPGLGQMKAQLKPAPALAESRLMMSPYSADQLYFKPANDLKRNYLLDRLTFLANNNILDGLPKVDGFFSLYLRESDRVMNLLEFASARHLTHLEDLFAVSQTIAPGKVFDWVPRSTYVPILSIGQQPIFATDQTAFAAIEQSTDVDFHKVVYLPTNAQGQVTARAEPAARIVAKDFQFTRETVEVDTPAPAMVCLSQSYYHNWRAAVDGKEVPLWRANYAFQAVEMPAGKHELELTYVDTAYRIGTLLAILAGLGCLALWWRTPAQEIK